MTEVQVDLLKNILMKKYSRLKNQLKKLTFIIVSLKEKCYLQNILESKNLIDFEDDFRDAIRQQQNPEIAVADQDLSSNSRKKSNSKHQVEEELKTQIILCKAKLMAKKIMIQNLTKENIDLFERIGEEREKHEIQIAYLEDLLLQNRIPFDRSTTIYSILGKGAKQKEKEIQPTKDEDMHEYATDTKKSILQTKNSKIATAILNRTIPKVHFDSETNFNAERVSSTASNGQSSPVKLQMTATQPVIEEFHEVDLPEDFEEEGKSEESEEYEDESDLDQQDENLFMDKRYEMKAEYNELDLPNDMSGDQKSPVFFEKIQNPRKNEIDELPAGSVSKKLRTYRKMDNFQFKDLSPLSSKTSLLEKSFKTTAGKYVQRKVHVPSAIPSKHQSSSASTHQSINAEKSPIKIIPILPNPIPSIISTSRGGQGVINRNTKQTTFKYNEVVRDKQTRKLMHGQDCPCCKDYYLATADLKRPGQGRSSLPSQNASKHRVWNARPATPPGYWTVDFPSTQEILEHQGKVRKDQV